MSVVNDNDIYWVDLNPIVGAEMQKVRPCVVVTSSIHGYLFRVSFRIEGRDGEIFTDQIRTIDKSRLKKEDCNTFS